MPNLNESPASGGSKARLGGAAGFYLFGAGCIVLAGLAASFFHSSRNEDLAISRAARATSAERGPRVEVIEAAKGPSVRSITLLADVRSNATATLYSKVSGYVKVINADRGDKVEEGQVLVQIVSPELESQYAAAITDLAHKRRNLARSEGLFAKGTTTQVSMFNFENDARVAEANLKGVEALRDYQTVRAPFAGRVTARFVDPGALVTNAQTNIVSALPVMTISDDSRLRVFAYVQQQDVPFVKVGDIAEVIDASNRDRSRKAQVTRMTGELDPKARAMQIEINIDNSDNFLTSGSFAYVSLQIPITSFTQIPVSGLIVRGTNRFVAVVDNNQLEFKPIRVQSTDGNTISIASGLEAGQRIAVNLPDEVKDGSRIQPIVTKR